MYIGRFHGFSQLEQSWGLKMGGFNNELIQIPVIVVKNLIKVNKIQLFRTNKALSLFDIGILLGV